mmetsp:Transcript_135/g.400  ORF Transcript_135/g.400 Transcript_135/m.400 type:complete len:283 (+) Transcript_135:497-1345(+)
MSLYVIGEWRSNSRSTITTCFAAPAPSRAPPCPKRSLTAKGATPLPALLCKLARFGLASMERLPAVAEDVTSGGVNTSSLSVPIRESLLDEATELLLLVLPLEEEIDLDVLSSSSRPAEKACSGRLGSKDAGAVCSRLGPGLSATLRFCSLPPAAVNGRSAAKSCTAGDAIRDKTDGDGIRDKLVAGPRVERVESRTIAPDSVSISASSSEVRSAKQSSTARFTASGVKAFPMVGACKSRRILCKKPFSSRSCLVLHLSMLCSTQTANAFVCASSYSSCVML